MRNRSSHPILWASLAALLILPCVAVGTSFGADAWHSPPVSGQGGAIIVKIVLVEDEDEEPTAAGKAAAKKLMAAMSDTPLTAVLLSECFEDLEYKQEMLDGVCSVIPKEKVFGESTYGSFSQEGCTDFDSVCLMGIGGNGISVAASLVTKMGVAKLTFEESEDLITKRLHAAGGKLAGNLRRTDQDRVLILLADAHAPKNQCLVEGLQEVLGGSFPITGGCANKNAGQTFVYFQGKPYRDGAIALMLSGDFRFGMSGRKAMDNDQVISSAKDGATKALANLDGKPLAAMAFNCAGRRGKLRRPEDELAAIQAALGKKLPLFGCYCAGEMGPVDAEEKDPNVFSGGSGWHVMFTVIGR